MKRINWIVSLTASVTLAATLIVLAAIGCQQQSVGSRPVRSAQPPSSAQTAQEKRSLLEARRAETPAEVSPSIPPACVATPSCPSPSAMIPGVQDLAVAHNTEAYDRIVENEFRKVADHPLSTFSIDVDTASYSNVRRFLNDGQLPPPDAVRIEELINYFDYSYAGPADQRPFAVHAGVAACPWNGQHRLARIGIKGRPIAQDARPASNLVFLLDISGSMEDANKLPLVRKAMGMLLERLGENDRVAIVVYASGTRRVLDATACDKRGKDKVRAAINKLQAGGSTNGAGGIQLAYESAAKGFIKGGVNRVILCTDGDFNVGVTDQGQLTRLIEDKARTGIFLSVLGFGMGNYKDSTLEKLADKGNGNYAYIDTELEARKVLVDQMSGTLVTIAKDVKIQVEFNPARVAGYRLVGYENRMLRKEDFNDDTKDAGEIGAGHTVTALYEIIPAGQNVPAANVDALKYQQTAPAAAGDSRELMTVKLRYKAPDADTSDLLSVPVSDSDHAIATADEDFRFATAVAAFGMVLRESKFKGDATLAGVEEMARAACGKDANGYRKEFVDLVVKARKMQERLARR